MVTRAARLSRRRQHRTTRFTRAEVDAHIDRRHPFCPPDVRESITRRIIERWWDSGRIGRAFGIVSENFVRHAMTDYERLLYAHHLERKRARQMVAPELGPSSNPGASREIRLQCRKVINGEAAVVAPVVCGKFCKS
jgi:hypothetical protein